MAEVTWTRPPTPRATITLVMSEDEARAVLTVLNGKGEVWKLRRQVEEVYGVIDSLKDTLDTLV